MNFANDRWFFWKIYKFYFFQRHCYCIVKKCLLKYQTKYNDNTHFISIRYTLQMIQKLIYDWIVIHSFYNTFFQLNNYFLYNRLLRKFKNLSNNTVTWQKKICKFFVCSLDAELGFSFIFHHTLDAVLLDFCCETTQYNK